MKQKIKSYLTQQTVNALLLYALAERRPTAQVIEFALEEYKKHGKGCKLRSIRQEGTGTSFQHRLNPKLLAWLTKFSEQQGKTRSHVVEFALEDYLEKETVKP